MGRGSFAFLAVFYSIGSPALAADWPGWRGPRGDGICEEKGFPLRWSAFENTLWRVETPGDGHSSPITFGDALYLTAAVGGENGGDARRLLIRFDKLTGEKSWELELLAAPRERKHTKNSHASGTPAADGDRVYTCFVGNGRVQVAAVGHDGKPQWRVSPCGFNSMHGYCTSPVLYGDVVVVNCDQDGDEAAIFAFERGTGKVRWRTERPNHVRSYVPPLIFNGAGRDQLVLSGSKTVSSYEPFTGLPLWSCEGPTEQCVASAVQGHGLVFITGGYPDREILAIRPDGQGDVTKTHIAWRARKGVAYVPSPLAVGDEFFVVSDETGVACCYDAKTGALRWQERLGGRFNSSMVYADGRIYLGSEEGDVHVFSAGAQFERLAKNEMGEGIFASPAFSDGRIYIRTTKALYAVGRSGRPPDGRLVSTRDLNGYHPWSPPATPAAWKARARRVRHGVLVSAGLWPMPEPAPFDAVVHGEIDRDDYTVHRVFFQSYPGFYVTGNLYRPKGPPPASGRRPAVLNPHGHWRNGRLYENEEKSAEAQIKDGKEKTIEGARYPLQARSAQLARMGCVVFFYDMVGVADSKQIEHGQGFRDAEAELRLQSAFGLQTYNSLRAFEFLAGLPDVDPSRIGVTGASGGGTQTFSLCAIDDRPAAAFPAVMVSTAMQGGCVCENASLLRVGTGNIEFAALCAPRPLGMTGANDWTIDIEKKGLPELKALYAALGVPDNVQAKCFPQFEHNYNQVSRKLMYNFMNRHLKLGLPEPIVEQPFQPVPPAELRVFDAAHPRPADADDAAALRKKMTEASDRQMAALRPVDAARLAKFREVVGTALGVITATELPRAEEIETRPRGILKTQVGARPVTVERFFLSRRGAGEAVPAVLVTPDKPSGAAIVMAHSEGKETFFAGPDGKLPAAAVQAVTRGTILLAVDPFFIGEGHPGGMALLPHEVHKEYAGYTFGYNRTVLANRVHDVLTAVGFARSRPGVQGVWLLGIEKAGIPVLLASAVAGGAVEKTAVDVARTRFEEIRDLSDPLMLPGAVKYGGLPAFAALCAPRRLLAYNSEDTLETARDAYAAAGAPKSIEVKDAPMPLAEAMMWLLR